jgi:hypothetical protein
MKPHVVPFNCSEMMGQFSVLLMFSNKNAALLCKISHACCVGIFNLCQHERTFDVLNLKHITTFNCILVQISHGLPL